MGVGGFSLSGASCVRACQVSCRTPTSIFEKSEVHLWVTFSSKNQKIARQIFLKEIQGLRTKLTNAGQNLAKNAVIFRPLLGSKTFHVWDRIWGVQPVRGRRRLQPGVTPSLNPPPLIFLCEPLPSTKKDSTQCASFFPNLPIWVCRGGSLPPQQMLVCT